MERPRWEILIGDTNTLDYLHTEQEDLPHPLQEIIERIIEDELTDDEREVFYMRYGERLSIREIGRRHLGYVGNATIQAMLASIKKKVREALAEDN